MTKKETQTENKTSQEAQWASFFKIDPENWPEIPQPTPKSKKLRNPYKLLGVVNFNDPVLPPPLSSVLDTKIVEKPQKDKEEGELKSQTRRLATSLIRKFQTGEIELDEVRNFYYENAEVLVDKKPFWAYCQYSTKNNLKTMSWAKYARQKACELFINDLFHLIPPHYSKPTGIIAKIFNYLQNIRLQKKVDKSKTKH